MKNNARTLCVLVGAAFILTAGLTSATSAEPLYGRPVHAPEPTVEPNANTNENHSGAVSNTGSDTADESKTGKNQTDPIHSESGETSNVSTTQMTGDVPSRLNSGQLKSCQEHASNISGIMDNANTRAKNQIALFSSIATRVESFYVSKGKTVANYSALVAAVNSAETQASSDLAILTPTAGFSCNGNNPSGVVSTYRANLKTAQTDIKNLRTSVRNLIVAVAQAEGYTLSKSAVEGSGQ